MPHQRLKGAPIISDDQTSLLLNYGREKSAQRQKSSGLEASPKRNICALACVLTAASLYFGLLVLDQFSFPIDHSFVLIGLPNAAAVAFLLATRPDKENAVYAALALLGVLALALSGADLTTAVGHGLASVVLIKAVTWLARQCQSGVPDMSRILDAARFALAGGVVGPLIAASLFVAWMWSSPELLGETPKLGGAEQVWLAFCRFFLTSSLAMILVVPCALLVYSYVASGARPPARTLVEGVSLLLLSALGSVLIFTQDAFDLGILILPITVMHAYRFGSLGAALHGLVVATVSISMTATGLGPIAGTGASETLALAVIHAFNCANALLGLGAVALVGKRSRDCFDAGDARRDLALLADNITDAVLKIDASGVCSYASPAVRDVLAAEPEALLGRSIQEIIQGDSSQRIDDVLARLLGGESNKERLTYRRHINDKTGAPVFIEADCAVVRNNDAGKSYGVIVSARDVSERVELELMLTSARRHAENAASAQSDFLANMSHEIRTPMNGVLGFAELVLQGELEPEQRRYTEKIVESGRSMMLLLNDILDLSKIESGEIIIDPGPIDLHATLEECMALHRPAAEKRGLGLWLERDCKDVRCTGHPVMPTVVTDGLRLRQIMLNLVGNAVKFTESGEVRVLYRISRGELRVQVRDTGIGISPSRLDKIFRPFTQGDNETAHRFGGTGLGLTISRRLAELLGGRIEVESAPGVGSTFSLILPAATIEPSEVSPDSEPAVSPTGLPQEGRILLVEDHDVNRMLMTEMLERCGQNVAIAQDGNEAISMVIDGVVRLRPFDLVLMDIQMPECDGYEATLAIREAGIGPAALPIVALTANVFAKDVKATRTAGMQAHLAKPIVFSELVRALQRWLPTRIVEAPMDHDVPVDTGGEPVFEESALNAGAYQTPAAQLNSSLGRNPEEDPSNNQGRTPPKESVLKRWLARRHETTEAVREGLGNGLIANINKRRDQDKADRDELVRSVHKLAGTAATFGEPELGEAAAALERAMAATQSAERCEELAFAFLALADEPPNAAQLP